MKSEEMLIPGRRSRSRATVSRYRSTRGGRFMSLSTRSLPGLHRQVQVARELRHAAVRVREIARHLGRMGRGVPDPPDPADRRGARDQPGEARGAAAIHRAAVRIDVLPEEGHLAHPAAGEAPDFVEDVLEPPAELLPPGVRNDAERAVLAAPLHHRYERGGSVHPGLGQAIELLDLGKAHVHARFARTQHVVQHPRHPLQGPRTVDDVHVGRPGAYRVPLLARDAPPDPDDQSRAAVLEGAPAPELREHLLLGLLPHRAGVDEENVRLLRPLRELKPVRMGERIRGPRGVVLVHLAAEGANEELSGRIHELQARAQEL